jgi:hypothetical protein
MGMCGGSSNNAALARMDEEARQGRIQEGLGSINKTFGQFNDKFYNQRAQDYQNYAMPQLYQQMNQANKQGFYGLADRGLQVSGAANQFGSALGRETNLQKQGIVDTGIGQAQQLRKDVEGQRSQLVSQLQASADPTTAGQQALQAASAYSLPSMFTPIGNLFGNFASIYAGNQLAKAYNPSQYSSGYGLNNSAVGNRSYSIK